MMSTLATVLAGKKIPTLEERYWADVKPSDISPSYLGCDMSQPLPIEKSMTN
jgi:hypothetical protein